MSADDWTAYTPPRACSLCSASIWREQSLLLGVCAACFLLVRNGDVEATLWVPVAGFARRYDVSSEAEVRNRRSKRLITIDRSGRYDRVTIDGERLYLHDVVMSSFVGPKPVGLMVLHRDDHGDNPRLSNLSYGDGGENHIDAVRNGRRNRKETG